VVIDTKAVAFIGIKGQRNGFGFYNMILKVIEQLYPDRLVFAFDSELNWRKKIHPSYKANRTPDVEFNRVYGIIYKALTEAGLTTVKIDGYEADDIIASVPDAIVSNDSDLFQLGRWQHLIKAGKFIAHKHPNPQRYLLEKCLLGDPSDNLKGVFGYGPKKVAKVTYQTCDEFYNSPIGAVEKEQFRLARQLIELHPIKDFHLGGNGEFSRPRITNAVKIHRELIGN